MRMNVRKHRSKNIWPFLLILVSVIAFVTYATSSEAGWLIYHKPAFKGKVIDAETQQPIEGAVVVALYHAECLGLGHGGSVTIAVKETLTDKKGEFSLKSNFSFYILPWCLGGNTNFIIFKPGYGKFLPHVLPRDEEVFFSEDFGKEREIEFLKGSVREGNGPELHKVKVTFGVVELPRVKTREERIEAIPGHLTDGMDKAPILNRLIDEEDKALGFK